MPLTIDQNKISQEVKDKYNLVNNAFRRVAKPDPKDLVIVEVGDKKDAANFFPQVKIGRWGNSENDNEVNLSVRLKHSEVNPKIATEGDKIKWQGDRIEVHFYEFTEGEGGMKMVWYLKSKPVSNKVEFSLQSNGLDFFYQPPLTQEYKNGYSDEFQKEIIVSETQVKDLDGNVLMNRPENVVGSYAVYTSEQKTNWEGGKLYGTGKFGHIYRPHITDSVGKETWGILKIENGIYSVEISQDFLDKAVYPIKSNDVIGWESEGASTTTIEVHIVGGRFASPGAGTGTKMTVWIDNSASENSRTVKCNIYDDGDGDTDTSVSLVANGGTEQITIPAYFKGKQDFSFPAAPTFVSAVYYRLTVWSNTGISTIYANCDTSVSGNVYDKIATYGTWPNPITSWTRTADKRLSIYATYTAGVVKRSQGFIF